MNIPAKYILKFLKYKITSKHKKGHGIHSPFLYSLIREVFLQKEVSDDLKEVIRLHKAYSRSNKLIEYKPKGVKSTDKPIKESIGSIIKKSSVNVKYGQLLFNLVKHFNPQNMLELGTSVGISTAYMAQGNEHSKFISIEGVPEKINIAKEIYDKLKHKNIHFLCDDFNTVLQNVIESFEKIDLVYFDGNHKKESTINYFETCLQKIHNESIFVFDDIYWSDEMAEAWNYIKNHQKVSLSVDIFRMGLIFFKKEMSKENYVIKF